MKMPSRDMLELRKMAARSAADLWKGEAERRAIHLKLYTSDEYIEKFGDHDANNCIEQVAYAIRMERYYRSKADGESPTEALAERLGIEL